MGVHCDTQKRTEILWGEELKVGWKHHPEGKAILRQSPFKVASLKPNKAKGKPALYCFWPKNIAKLSEQRASTSHSSERL